MFGSIVSRILGSGASRRMSRRWARVAEVGALEAEVRALDDAGLRARTDAFRARIAAGATTDELLVPAFATVREAARRVLGQRHHDVQLVGGMVLHEGAIAEMRTGEGKTLVSTLAVYLAALAGKGVHVVTVNDYLAARDAAEMGRVHGALGLTVGVIAPGTPPAERRAAYAADVTYGTNSEFGFDFLRDNMEVDPAACVQRGHAHAVVDEVDSILIDEARTPLIISGLSGEGETLCRQMDMVVPRLAPDEVDVDEKVRSVALNEKGDERLEGILRDMGFLEEGSPYDAANAQVMQHLRQALIAHHLFQRDRDYVVRDGEVVIVDVGTGRLMPGRRYGQGLHQAIEAKERVAVQPETVTLASVTYQNYFRGYERLSGMTGTASTEAEEFTSTYGLDVVTVPTHRPVARVDMRDEVYRTADEKLRAVVADVTAANDRMQPVLVGTTSVERSEELADRLVASGFRRLDLSDAAAVGALREAARSGRPSRAFAVLNARHHEQEAAVVAEAGLPGAVTIATNMAGRGTDVRLGGHPDHRVAEALRDLPEGVDRDAAEAATRAEVRDLAERAHAAGGLLVIGTERHESRRIDDQLRGRSGRQGDPGRSKFMMSLEDDLVRLFGAERIGPVLDTLGLREGDAIVHPFVDRTVAKAQRKVEERNLLARREVLKYDDVLNMQRRFVFGQRRALLAQGSLAGMVKDMREGTVNDVVEEFMPKDSYPEAWDLDGLAASIRERLAMELPVAEWAAEEGVDGDDVADQLHEAADAAYAARVAAVGEDAARQAERVVTLRTLDALWREHIVAVEDLRQVIGWRGVAQRDPLQEFKAETHELYERMIVRLRQSVTATLMRMAPPPVVAAAPEPVAAEA